MRSLLIALLAFVAGVWLTTWWQPATSAATAAHPVEVKRDIESAYSAHIETQQPGAMA